MTETDCDFLERVLADGQPHNLNEIIQRSFRERDCGLTVHSRVSDLRTKRGLDIRHWQDGERGAGSWYRLVSAGEASDGHSASPTPSPPSDVSPADADGQLLLTGPAFRKRQAA